MASSTNISLERELLIGDICHAVDQQKLRNQQKTVLTSLDAVLRIPDTFGYKYQLTAVDKATLLAKNGLTITREQSTVTRCHNDHRDYDMCTCAPTIEYYYRVSW